MFKVSKSGYSAISAVRQSSKPLQNSSLGTNSRKLDNATETSDRWSSQSNVAMQMSGTPNGTVAGNAITIDVDPMLMGLTPQTERALHIVYKDIYFNESVAGCAVDLISSLPFSEFSLGGLATQRGDLRKVHHAYEEVLERLNLRTLLPEMSVDYLVMGKHCSSLLYNKEKRTFTDVLPHPIDSLTIEPLPFYSQDPIINVTFQKSVIDIMGRTDSPRIKRIREHLGPSVVNAIMKGSMELDPLSTIFIPRRTFSANDTGTSYLRRILPIYLIEKNLFRGTLVESARRQRGIMHVTLGDGDQWIPSVQDMEFITELFQGADSDPLGAIIATRMGVSVEEIRQGGEFWKSTDFNDSVLNHKLRALGISEAFLCLTGDMLVPTETGLQRLDEICSRNGLKKDEGFDIDIPVRGFDNELVRAKKWYYRGKSKVSKVTTASGGYVRGTKKHKVLTLGRTLNLVWKKVGKLSTTDFLCGDLTRTDVVNQPLDLPQYVKSRMDNSSAIITVPDKMTTDLAWLLGLILAEGCVDKNRVRISNSEAALLGKAKSILEGLGVHVSETKYEAAGEDALCINGRVCNSNVATTDMSVSSVVLCDTLQQLGVDFSVDLWGENGKYPSYNKQVPHSILSSGVEQRLAFLAGFIEGDGSIKQKVLGNGTSIEIILCSRSKNLLSQAKIILADLGYQSIVRDKRLYVRPSVASDLYFGLQPYMVGYKSDVFFDVVSAHGRCSGIPTRAISEMFQQRFIKFEPNVGAWFKNDAGEDVLVEKFAGRVTSVVGSISNPRNGILPYHSIEKGLVDDFLYVVQDISDDMFENIRDLFKLRYVFDPVVSVEDDGVEHVYDLSIEPGKVPAFVANGYVVHNSGDANYSTGDAALSVFLDTIRTFRDMMTRKLFYNKLFPLISLINGFTTKNGRLSIQENLVSQVTSEEALQQLNDSSKLFVPSVHWNKQLKPEGDTAYMEMLNGMTEKGIPVPLRMLAAAGGMDIDTLVRQQDEDIDMRKRVAEYLKKITALAPKPAAGEESESSAQDVMAANQLVALAAADPTGKIRSSVLAERGGRVPILSRDFSRIEPYATTKTGKKKVIHNRAAYERKANEAIVRTLRNRDRRDR